MSFIGDGSGRGHGDDAGQGGEGHGHTERSACCAQHDAFGEQLAYQAAASGAERGADGDLAPPERRAREKQVGDVDAGDGQQQADRAEQDPERVDDAARKGLFEGAQFHTPLFGKIVGVLARQFFDDGPHSGLRLRHGHAGREARHQVDFMYAFDILPAMKDVWQVDIGATPHEALRHDADHSAHFAVEQQLAPEDGRVAAEFALPEFIPQQSDGRRVSGGVRGNGGAANQRRYAHPVEGVHSAMIAARAARFARAGPGDVGPGGCHHVAEDRAAPGNFQELVDRVVAPVGRAAHRIADHHADQAVDVAVGEWVKNDCVHHAVHGGAAAHAEG